MKYSPQLFIKNIKYLVQYGCEPEIELILQNDKKIFIIAYEDFIDFYDEKGNYQKLGNIQEVIQKIDFAKIGSIVEYGGIDFSRPIQEQSLLVDGVLYLTPQSTNAEQFSGEKEHLDDWRIKGNEDYLNNLTLYKIKFPEFWKKSCQLKNTFYKMVVSKGEELVRRGTTNKRYLEKGRIHHIWHEHCELCWEKALTSKCCTFYCTKDFQHWICQECLNDFKDKFYWTVKSGDELL